MSGDDNAVVLVVEDEPEMIEMYRLYLKEYDVRGAAGGEAALEAIDDDVDVVLLDRRMPEMPGSEVLEEIRARGFDCRVVMVTAVDPDLDLLDMDFDEYLVKPVSRDEIQTAVERMLARTAFENRIQEMFSLASKLATLEMKLDIEQLEQSEQYQQLVEEFAAHRQAAKQFDETQYYSDATLDKIRSILEEAQ
jgi:DNA-binding response OmpR family regulator